MAKSYTKTCDGYRWLIWETYRSFEDHTRVYKLSAQKRGIDCNGRVHFIFGVDAEFDSPGDRAKFMENFQAKDWWKERV